MNLVWANESSASGGPVVYAEGVSPGMGKHCVLGHVTDPRYRKELGEDLEGVPDAEALFALELEVKPNSRTHLLASGVYRLELHVAAANSKPTKTTLELTATGRWFENETEMLRDGIGLRVLSEHR